MKHAGQCPECGAQNYFFDIAHCSGAEAPASWPTFCPAVICYGVIAVWVLFVLFTLYFFRDPTASLPHGPGLGGVAAATARWTSSIKWRNPEFMGGPCHRISIFLSVINVHVQNAPISGKVSCVTHTPGKFISALEPIPPSLMRMS